MPDGEQFFLLQFQQGALGALWLVVSVGFPLIVYPLQYTLSLAILCRPKPGFTSLPEPQPRAPKELGQAEVLAAPGGQSCCNRSQVAFTRLPRAAIR